MTRRFLLLLACWILGSIELLSQVSRQEFDADSLFLSAVRLQRAGELSAARGLLRRMLNRYPSYHDARIMYARLLGSGERYREGLMQVDSVLAVQPGNQDARFARAQILAWSGQYRQAATLIQELVQEDSTSAIFLTELAKVYFWGKSARRALEFYERAYLLAPESEDVLRGLARTHRQLKSYDRAILWYRRLLKKVPGDKEARAEIFRLLYRADHEIQIQGSYESFTTRGIKEHWVSAIEYYASVTEDWKPYLHASRFSRFGEKENRFGIGSYVTLSYAAQLFVQGVVSPQAKVGSRSDILGELTIAVGGDLEGIAGYRYLGFETTKVHVVAPGFTYYVDNDLWFSPRVYLGFGSARTRSRSFVATLFYHPEPLTTIRVGIFGGDETFRATTLSELTTLRSTGLLVAIKSRIDKRIAVEGDYQYNARTVGSHSHLFTFTFSLLF